MTKRLNRIISCLMVAFMLLTTLGVSNVYAAGVETFRLNKNYEVGEFTFTDGNTTPTKTVEGRYLYTYFNMLRASSDQGIASTPIKITVDVIDASTRQTIKTAYYIINPGQSMDGGFETDLGYAGRKICYRFDASSYNGPTNGNYRSAYVQRFMVNTSNIQGTYFNN